MIEFVFLFSVVFWSVFWHSLLHVPVVFTVLSVPSHSVLILLHSFVYFLFTPLRPFICPSSDLVFFVPGLIFVCATMASSYFVSFFVCVMIFGNIVFIVILFSTFCLLLCMAYLNNL